MKPGQKTIYWIAGMSQDEVARSPFAEKLVAEVRAVPFCAIFCELLAWKLAFLCHLSRLFEWLGFARMKPGQKTIYWIAGMSQDKVARSPFAEKLVAEVRAVPFYAIFCELLAWKLAILCHLSRLFEWLGFARMKPGQKTIYWIAGMSQDEVARSPFAEKLVAEV
jgi:HSP90 family molecular chaperone